MPYRATILAVLALTVGLLSVRVAQSRPATKPVRQATLTLQFKLEELPPLVEQPPIFGRAFYGQLTTQLPRCRTGRRVFASYTFPPYTAAPLIRPMWGNGEGPIKTDGLGRWQAKPVVFAETAYRVVAVVKARFGCPRVESKPLTLPPG